SPEGLAIMQEIQIGRVATALRRTDIAQEVVREILMIARAAMEHHLERRIRASSLFEVHRTA
ncbi:MAG: hypothetical protein ACKOXX_02505, partial [Actinomycetota bacterium]